MSFQEAVSLSKNGSAAPAALNFAPIRTRRGYEQIYDIIVDAIATAKLRPGDRLPAERDLAETFQVSRQAVREAMRGLESNGLVTVRLGVQGGVFISGGDIDFVSRAVSNMASLNVFAPDDLLEARIQLTSDVIRLACERATEEDLAKIEADIRLTEESIQLSGAERTKQVTFFYRLLAEATHNEVLVMLNDALAQAVYVRLMRGGPAVNENIGNIRRSIVQHIREKSPEAAIEELTNHLRWLESSMEESEGN